MLDNVVRLLVFLGLISSIVACLALIIGRMEDDERKSIALLSSGKKALFSSIVLWTVCVFTPNTKQAAVIIVLPEIANNKKLQAECTEMYDLTKSWLKGQMNADIDKTH
jgi:hypothetical protein